MDEANAPHSVARWYSVSAIGALLFMLIGCLGFLVDIRTDPATLPLDQRTLVLARPMWSLAAYGVAVWIGLVGTILLWIRRRLAEPLLLVSLIAAVATFLPYAIVPGVRDNISTNDIAFALGILAITWTIFWFARRSRQRGWLT